MTYSVKEIFYTLQGEGAQAGRAAVFCRFAGCNLWSGREEDRVQAQCTFCDTDFVGTDGTQGGKYEAEALAEAGILVTADGLKPSSHGKRVLFDGSGRLVTDGPFAETKEALGGFYLVEAADLDEGGKASGPDFWKRVQALGDKPYYPPPKL